MSRDTPTRARCERASPASRARAGWRRGVSALVVVAALLAITGGVAHAVDPNQNQDQAVKKERRFWFVDALLETHWIVVRDNFTRNDVFNFMYLRGNVELPKKLGRLTLRLQSRVNYVRDDDETNFLFGDIWLSYSHGFNFNIKGVPFGGRAYLWWTFPTSRTSRREGNIARPTAMVALHKPLPFGIDLFARPYARLNWARFAEAEGGQPNVRWQLGYEFLANWTLPWHKRLSFGGVVGQYWFDRYPSREGAAQPWNWWFYWETYAGYSILQKPLALDAYLTLGSGNRGIQDGVSRFRFLDRDETEMYVSFRARY